MASFMNVFTRSTNSNSSVEKSSSSPIIWKNSKNCRQNALSNPDSLRIITQEPPSMYAIRPRYWKGDEALRSFSATWGSWRSRGRSSWTWCRNKCINRSKRSFKWSNHPHHLLTLMVTIVRYQRKATKGQIIQRRKKRTSSQRCRLSIHRLITKVSWWFSRTRTVKVRKASVISCIPRPNKNLIQGPHLHRDRIAF